jgi:hypothetical protein
MAENKQDRGRPQDKEREDYARPNSSKPESASKPAKAAYENRGRDRASGAGVQEQEGGHEPDKFRDHSQRSPEAGRKVGGGREDS